MMDALDKKINYFIEEARKIPVWVLVGFTVCLIFSVYAITY